MPRPPLPPQSMFGYYLRRLRYGRQWTAETAAAHCGMIQANVSQYERGNRHPSASMAKRLAEGFNVSYEELWAMVEQSKSIKNQLGSQVLDYLEENFSEEFYDNLWERFPKAPGLRQRQSRKGGVLNAFNEEPTVIVKTNIPLSVMQKVVEEARHRRCSLSMLVAEKVALYYIG